MWARGARSPLAPTLPRDGMMGVMWWLRRSHKRSRDLGPNAGEAFRQDVGTDEHHAANDGFGERLADAGAMGADQIDLHLLDFTRIETDIRQQSNAGVEGIDRL